MIAPRKSGGPGRGENAASQNNSTDRAALQNNSVKAAMPKSSADAALQKKSTDRAPQKNSDGEFTTGEFSPGDFASGKVPSSVAREFLPGDFSPNPAALLRSLVDRETRDALAALDLDNVLAALFADARAAWPGLRVSDERFARQLAAHLTAERAPSLASWPAADLYLACACLEGDAAAVRAFDERYLAGAGAAAAALRGGAAVAEDVKQILRQELFAPASRSLLANYSGAGSLRGWLRAIAVRIGLRLVHADRRAAPGDDAIFSELATAGNAELAHLKDAWRREINLALREALAALPARQRTLLRQHFIDGLTVDQLGRLQRVHRATAARRVAAARAALMTEARRRAQARLKIEKEELDSIVRLVLSQLELSLDLLGSI